MATAFLWVSPQKNPVSPSFPDKLLLPHFGPQKTFALTCRPNPTRWLGFFPGSDVSISPVRGARSDSQRHWDLGSPGFWSAGGGLGEPRAGVLPLSGGAGETFLILPVLSTYIRHVEFRISSSIVALRSNGGEQLPVVGGRRERGFFPSPRPACEMVLVALALVSGRRGVEKMPAVPTPLPPPPPPPLAFRFLASPPPSPPLSSWTCRYHIFFVQVDDDFLFSSSWRKKKKARPFFSKWAKMRRESPDLVFV